MTKIERALAKVQKPSRYAGGEFGAVIKEYSSDTVSFAFCFPDLYEIGMSHLGMKILYSLINREPGYVCERVFAPAADMESEMREGGIPLFSLETRRSVAEFDFVGFTLQTEMSYSNILLMLDLAGIPLRSADRKSLSPIVVAGGPCAMNPEPLADFVDLFMIGEGEEVLIEVMDAYKKHRERDASREEFLLHCAKEIGGVYVPALYDVVYGEDGMITDFSPNKDGVPARVQKRIIEEIDGVFFPEYFVVPGCEIVHDRAMLEIFRGCVRGCRFCQAGVIYRPHRAKSPHVLEWDAKNLIASTGYDELSLTSLSTSDYAGLPDLAGRLVPFAQENKVNMSLPSLRVDNFSIELLDTTSLVRKGGLTFAPEAGTQRMRDVINKNVEERELMEACRIAFDGGRQSVKLYFMIGLPTETDEDVLEIAGLANRVVDFYYSEPKWRKMGAISVSIGLASFVPKPFTPFQWVAQDGRDILFKKLKMVKDAVNSRRVHVSWNDTEISFMEAVFARGDRRLGPVLERAYRLGARFDNWDDLFNFDIWLKSFDECGVNPAFYANREREYGEVLPWDFIDVGVTKEYLVRESELSKRALTSISCREGCLGCGAAGLGGGDFCAKSEG